MSNDYTCAMCGETFEKGVSDAEVIAECEQLFGTNPTETDCATVCDYCFQKIRPDRITQ